MKNKVGVILPSYNRYGSVNGVDLCIVGEPLFWFPNRRKLYEFAEEHGIYIEEHKQRGAAKREITTIRGIGWRDPDFGPRTYKTKYARRVTKTYFRK